MKDENTCNTIIILLVIVAVYFLIQYMGQNRERLDNVDVGVEPIQRSVQNILPEKPFQPLVQATGLATPANEPNQMAFSPANEPIAVEQKRQIDNVVAGSAKLTAEDLLPKYNDANEFAKQNPVSNLLKEQNFLVSGYHAGINTISQSNKIPYLDIRVLPPIPKEQVGPWNQSSYEQSPASLRRGVEIL